MDAVFRLPEITKYWSVCIAVTTLAAEFKLVSGMKLMFNPEKAFSTQPWRLFTSFCYHGELLIPILMSMVSNIKWSKMLEESHSVPMSLFPEQIYQFNPTQQRNLQTATSRLKPMDYLYYLLLIGGSIVAMTTFGFYYLHYAAPMLGYILHEVLTYIYIKQNPQVEVAVIGIFTLRGMQIPLFLHAFYWVTSEYFQAQLHLLLTGDFLVIPQIFTSPIAWKSFVCLSLGHFWWFIYDMMFGNFYLDKNPIRRASRFENPARYKQLTEFNQTDYVRKMMQAVLLPPWYWFILYNIKHNRFRMT